jgi:two-component system chemotaxis sensor kinase CheA
MNHALDEITREFLIESDEHLARFEGALLAAEADPTAAPLLDAMFRSIHSIKGSCGFLGFSVLESLAHAGESLLGRLRDGRLVLDASTVGALLGMVDTIRALLRAIEESGKEGGADVAPAIAALDAVARRAGDGERKTSAAPELDVVERLDVESSKIRVDVALLDRLMNLVGELVLCRNQILQLGARESSAALAAPAQQLNLVTSEIQGAVMKTRMQPIGNVWNRFPRLVRDVASASGKLVRLRMDGSGTELDRWIIEAIADPLSHLVRNAIDHGVETSARRREVNKPEEATISLAARHEGGLVNIEIHDDGAGVDLDAVKRKAVARGLMSSAQTERLTEREILQLIFLPGFSTSERVTTVSGRGVGMDVVRTNIERIGGTVDVETERGVGTTVKIKIPLTLAIIPALIVTSNGQRYAIPQASVVEVVRVDSAAAGQHIELVHGAPVFRLRTKLLPLAFLSTELGTGRSKTSDDAIVIVVLQADARQIGLVVDGLRDNEEIVVKALWKRLKPINCYAGATVMGDGRVALVLDAMSLAQRVGVLRDERQRIGQSLGARSEIAADARRHLVLLCATENGGRLAVPLEHVARLEELKRAQIERVSGRMVTQYRGEILPLVRAQDVLEERRRTPRSQRHKDTRDGLPVVVFSSGARRLGLIVDAIIDIVEVELRPDASARRKGVRGTMIIADRVTEILDVAHLVAAAGASAAEATP